MFRQIEWKPKDWPSPDDHYVSMVGGVGDHFCVWVGCSHRWSGNYPYNVAFYFVNPWGGSDRVTLDKLELCLPNYYTLQEVIDFAQAAWEHYVTTNFLTGE